MTVVVIAVVVTLVAVLLPVAVVSTVPMTVAVVAVAVTLVALLLPVAVVSTVPMTAGAAAIAVPIVIVLVPVRVLALPVFLVVPVVIAVILGDHDVSLARASLSKRDILCVALLTHAGQGGVLPTREANDKRESGVENESAAKAGQDHDVPPSLSTKLMPSHGGNLRRCTLCLAAG